MVLDKIQVIWESFPAILAISQNYNTDLQKVIWIGRLCWQAGNDDVGDWTLVIFWCWWLVHRERQKMLVTEKAEYVTNIENKSTANFVPFSVTNIDVKTPERNNTRVRILE